MTLWEQMVEFGKGWFVYPGLEWHLLLIAVGLALAIGALWLLAHWPPLFKGWKLWAAGVFGAFFTLAAIVFIQIPLQYLINKGLNAGFDAVTIQTWILLAGIPSVAASGFVQEAAKMVPIVFWWQRSGRNLTPAMGLAIGAVVGAGFGIFEAFWNISSVFGAGWTLQAIQTDGFTGISPFWERFFVVGFHMAVSALAGYGVAKGKIWQYFLIAGALHTVMNYAVVILQHWYMSTGGMFGGYLAIVETEVYIAVVAVLVIAFVMLLRWSRRFHQPEEFMIEPLPVDAPAEPAIAESPEETPVITE